MSDAARRKRGKTKHRGWIITREEVNDAALPGEQWVDWDSRLKVSSLGRARIKDNLGDGWGAPFVPQPTAGNVYARVGAGGQWYDFHVLAFRAFGGVLVDDQTVDHIDGDASNNKVSNLRAAGKGLQSANRVSNLTNTTAIRIEGKRREADDSQWRVFASGTAAAAELSASENQKFDQGAISKVARGAATHHKGWVFRFE